MVIGFYLFLPLIGLHSPLSVALGIEKRQTMLESLRVPPFPNNLRDMKFDFDASNLEQLSKSCFQIRANNEDPKGLNVTFHLYTRRNPFLPYIMDPRVSLEVLLRQSPIALNRPIKWIIHGFRTNLHISDWMESAKDKILAHEDANVILTNWGRGASPWFSVGYPQAAANMFIVAQMIVNILRRLGTDHIDMNQVHLIGHSLGAHIMGFVGTAFAADYLELQKQLILHEGPSGFEVAHRRLSGARRHLIGRITGCDPALPCFGPKSEAPEWRPNIRSAISGRADSEEADWNHLKPDSGLLVEVLHSNPRILGYLEPLGDFDFYPNGFDIPQPGCRNATKKRKEDRKRSKRTVESVQAVVQAITCSHHRSVDYMVESLYSNQVRSTCQMVGYRCSSYENFKKGFCFECQRQHIDCRIFGSSPPVVDLEKFQDRSSSIVHQFGNRKNSIHQRTLPDLKESYANKQDIARTTHHYYFDTREEREFCLHHYHLRLNYRHYSLTDKWIEIEGFVLVGSYGQLNQSNVVLNRFTHHSLTALINDRSESTFLGPIESLTLFANDDKLKTTSIDAIELTYLSHLDPSIRRISSARLCRPMSSLDSASLAMKRKGVTVFKPCSQSGKLV